MPRNHAPRIPVTIVTGFLGSGKTTLINAGLKSPDLSKTVVVVNEFGTVALDHLLYTSSNDAVVVLENGCLCCTVRTDLIATMNSLYHDRARGDLPDFNNVVIETTGLAEPGPVIQAFLSEPTLDGLYRVVNVVTVVDAVNWQATAQNHHEALRQVALADDLLITKIDLKGEDCFSQLSAQLQSMNPAAKIAKADFSVEAIAPLLMHKGFDAADSMADPTEWLSIAAYEAHAHEIEKRHGVQDQDLQDQDLQGQDLQCQDLQGQDFQVQDTKDHDISHHLAATGIESFVLTRVNPITREELQFLLDGIGENLGTGLLRVKGLINILEEPGKPAVVQGVQHLLHNVTWLEKWPTSDERTRIVFITQGIARSKLEEIIEVLDRMSKRTFEARERGRLAREAAKRTEAMEASPS